MGFGEAVRSALDALWSHKLRSTLTMLGLVIGMFAVISSVTAVEVVETYFESSLTVLGTNVVEVQVRQPDEETREQPPPFTYRQVRRLEARSQLQVSMEVYFDRGSASFLDASTEPNVLLLGSNEQYPPNYGFTLTSGRSFSRGEVQAGRNVALLGASVAETLFPSVDPIGKEIRFKGLRLEVVGVLSKRGSFLGFSRDNRIIAPITSLLSEYSGRRTNFNSITIRAPSQKQEPATISSATGHLRFIRGLRPTQEKDFEFQTSEARQERISSFTEALAAGGAAVGAISLLAAGIGVMNVMFVSVTERTTEIGIRKAVGAKRRHILLQFLLEAVLLCQIGGLIGIALGALFGNGVALYFDLQMSVPWGWALGAVGSMLIAALAFGGYPAYQAARVDPIDSIRHP